MDITRDILIKNNFLEKEDKILREIAEEYSEEYNVFEKTTKDFHTRDVFIEINSILSNHPDRDWSVHIDNSSRETIASADIQTIGQFNMLMHIMDIDYKITLLE